MSKRQDGRGHWPKGKRRNPPPLVDLIPALRQFYRGAGSLRLIADECRVDTKTVRKWLSREWIPNPKSAKRLAKMLGA